MAGAGTSPRERYRTQLRAEIKEHAWEQIATAGASALSLKAIAKQLGMSGPALYRYYASRDDLITELIRDAYRSLADTLAAAAGDGLTGVGRALRGWALADPHRYHLLYGTPVPGYHAPKDTTAITSELMGTLLAVCGPRTEHTPIAEFDERLTGHRLAEGPREAVTLHRALSVWARLHGVLSLELAGHFTGMDFDPALLFEAELESLL
ncbi:TetR/AcrR family transcriptional regulator [Amycolatopsis sp. CA-230715]|uniref:TetR/AcrR family transcriptional regulator n=1 Tax=Amycolatopsis sp. CA-230715 TaxID=2745196 RepID=UPI001C023DEC|nr:TetR/AcrR family transcriptional regulator [Amycolatopsis sp. CA-230715]QWF78592.1 putative HTH-type transcriptional regulator [Amycolatopsis sp. CA-230715]